MRRSSLKQNNCRRGVAVVEMVFVLPLLLMLLLGIWEVGRIIHVQIIMSSAARDASRLAAQAYIVNTQGDATEVGFNTGTKNVEGSVRAYLYGAGITNLTGLQVQFQFVEASGTTPITPTGTNADPSDGKKNQRFRLRIILPYANVRWTTMSLLNPTNLTAEAYWQCMVDDPFTLNVNMPGWSP